MEIFKWDKLSWSVSELDFQAFKPTAYTQPTPLPLPTAVAFGLQFHQLHAYTIHAVIYLKNKIIPINSLAKFMHILSYERINAVQLIQKMIFKASFYWVAHKNFLLCQKKIRMYWYIKMVFISVISSVDKRFIGLSRLLCIVCVVLRLNSSKAIHIFFGGFCFASKQAAI